jgi:hypothetical protein
MMRKERETETPKYSYTSLAFVAPAWPTIPIGPRGCGSGSAVIVPVQKAPPFVEESLLIYRIPWTFNLPRPLQGEGVDVRFHKRSHLRKALRHERIQGQLERRHKYQLPHSGPECDYFGQGTVHR